MAVTYLPIGNTSHGQALLQGFRNLNAGRDQLERVLAIMTTAQDGSNFTALETAFGLAPGNGTLVYAELSSMLAKITTDASVSNVMSAWNQAAAKFGVF